MQRLVTPSPTRINSVLGSRWRFSASILISLVALLACLGAHAVPSASLRFEPLSIDQGLPQESNTAVAQDSLGFVWLATQAGLARFDGYKTVVFKNDPSNRSSLGDSWVHALLRDREGNLWVGTRKGLDRFDYATHAFVHYEKGMSREGNNGVNAILDSGDGALWLGTDQGLLRFDKRSGRFARFESRDSMATRAARMSISALSSGPDGTTWVGTPLGLVRIAPGGGSSSFYPADPGKPGGGMARSLLATAAGDLWVGTFDGLQRWKVSRDGLRRIALPEGSQLERGIISALLMGPDGALWVGTQDSGLSRYEPASGHFRRFVHDPTDPHSIGDNFVTALAFDRSNCLWVGTWSGGASYASLGSVGFERWDDRINSPVRLSDSKVYGIAGDGHGSLWFATRNGGLNRYTTASRELRVFRHREDFPRSIDTDHTLTGVVDRRGRVWVLKDKGLGYLDPQTEVFTPFALPLRNPLSTLVLGLYLQPNGEALWICSRDGLFRLDLRSEHVTQYHHALADQGSLADNFVTAVLEDRPGYYWVATFGGGLDYLNLATGKFTHHRHIEAQADSLSSNRVQTLMKDRRGTLWVGTSSGFNRAFRRADRSLGFRAYTSQDGLNGDSIGGILEDSRGLLWISTTAGLSRFDPSTGAFTRYDATDGITPGSFFVGSAYKDPDGKLYFGGVNGVTIVSPEKLLRDRWAPVPVLTDFCVLNQCIHSLKPQGFKLEGLLERPRRVTIPPHTAEFSIEFSALHFAAPDRNRFAYQLEGFDKTWVERGADRRVATYTNLAPGIYTFRVKAANKDGLWSESPLELEIEIEPAFWQTRWFAFVVFALLMLALFFGLRLRTRALRNQSAILRQKVTERTAQLEDALRKLEWVSLTDPLTGLYNRRFLTQQVDRDLAISVRQYEQAGAEGAQAAADADVVFFMIDIDYFKRINDEHGHAAGDSVLTDCCARLKATFRDSDYLVRWGGEEFLAVVRNSQREHASELAERIRRTIFDKPFVMQDGQSWPVSVSIGVASFPVLRDQPRRFSWLEVVGICDSALYAAKAAGRNGWVNIGLGDQKTNVLPLPSEEKEKNLRHIIAAYDLQIQTSFNKAEVLTWLGNAYASGSPEPDQTAKVPNS